MDLLGVIFDTFEEVVGMIGNFILALLPVAGDDPERMRAITGGELSGIFPLVAISIGASVIFLTIKIVKKISWGY